MLASKLLSAAGGTEQIFSDEVFSSFLYTGNSSTQTINNGIDLAGKGGLVWCKRRNGINNHSLVDTERGMTFAGSAVLASEQTSGTIYTLSNWMRADSTGFSLGSAATGADINSSGNTYVSHTFRKSAKFFDCGTYTGNGVAGRQIPHSLGVAPGMVIVKRIDSAANWNVYHRSTGATSRLELNTTIAAVTGTDAWGSTSPTSTAFTVGPYDGFNNPGQTYVWYAFAHDTSAEGIVQCGSFTTGADTWGSATLNWEPQFVISKRTTSADDWFIHDSMRGMVVGGNDAYLYANSSGAEGQSDRITPTATGFSRKGDASGETFIYLAIRRPNKPPTSGTQVYNAIARTGTGAAATVTGVGFAPDLLFSCYRANAGGKWFVDRLRGGTQFLQSQNTGADYTASTSAISFDNIDGFRTLGNDGAELGATNQSGFTYINHFFRRAPGVMDVVCYTGTGVARTVEHSLGVAPELVITKRRSSARDWATYVNGIGLNKYLAINLTNGAITDSTIWNNTAPTASAFSVGNDETNASGVTHIAYLWATKPGVSKCGSYTGNGSSQTIDCGFSTGCRFFLVKATSTTGSWWIFDSVRGVISAADPALQLNSAAAEITSADAVDPASVGIVVNQEATCSINASGVSYVYLALS